MIETAKKNLSFDRFRGQKLIIQSGRIGVFLLVLAMALLMHLGQPGFFNWNIYWQFYLTSFLGLALNLVALLALESIFARQRLLMASFFFDVLLISLLLMKSELSISLFLFLYLIEILLVALVFQIRGALLLAGWSSLCFSFVSLLGPELKAMSFFFSVILYNTAFFAMAWISGLMAQQLESQGITLNYLRILNQSIVDTIPSGLLTLDLSGQVIAANPAAIGIFKKTVEGLNLREMLPELAQKIEDGETKSGKKYEVPLRGEPENLILSVQMLPHQSDGNSYFLVLEDITEVRRLELNLLHQQKLAAIGGLASGIAHELGNPLAAVSANIQYLEPKIRIDDETDRKLIQNTHREIARLGGLIAEFKDFAKPEKIPVDMVNLNLVMKEVMDVIHADKSFRKDVALKTDYGKAMEIQGNKDKLVQAFLNVVMNAYQAVAEVAKPEVFISSKVVGLEMVVRVRDNGVGMSDETKARLFEPFYTTKGRLGTGLGLAVTYKILQAHKAKVAIESTKGQGTEFIFRFPLKSDSGIS